MFSQNNKQEGFFCEIAFTDGTSGCMRKRYEDSVSGINFLEAKQIQNFEDYQQECVKSKDGFAFGYEKYIKVHKETFNRVVYQY